MPKVSVIIPCYNAEKYLEQCLNSVRNQTLRDIEIICVDDGSTDRTVEMLREYAAEDSRMKVLCQKNKFAGVARNTGMDAATGEYLSFLDSDDYYELDGLEKAYAIAKENDVEMLKMSSTLLDDCTGEVTTNAHYSHEKFTLKDQIVQFKDDPQKLLNCADVAWNGLYSRKFIQDNQITFNNFRCVNDSSFYIHCLVTAKRIMVTDLFLTCYRRNIAGSLVSIRHKFFDCQTNSCKLIKKIINEAGLDSFHKRMILQFELNQIFIWYDKFLDAGVNTFYVEEIIRKFIAEFDINDVGADFLPKFQRKHHFERLKKSLEIKWQKEPCSENPKVTVVVPAYNGVKYLSECIESVLLQSLRDFEMIFVDDGSTDATVEMMECFAERDSRIRLMHQQQGGAGVARNNAIQAAKGKYLVFVDCDDKIRPDFLKDLYNAAETHRAEVVVTQRIAWYSVGEGSVMYNWLAAKYLPKDQTFSYKDVPDYILNFTDGAPGGKLFSREFVLKNDIRYLTIKRSEDFNFIFGAFVMAERVFFLEQPGYYYRKNNSTSLENTKDETPLLYWDATMTFKGNLEKLGVLEDIRRSYLNNTINRVAFNLKAVKTFSGFSSVFYHFKEICDSELELNDHESKYFFDNTSYDYLMRVLKYETPEDYLLATCRSQNQQLIELRQKSKNSKELMDIRNSKSYRIGRMITFVPRKIRGFFDCIRDHGLEYTVKYFFKKLTRSAK